MTAPFCPECGPTCPLHSSPTYLEPVRVELDRLRTENDAIEQQRDNWHITARDERERAEKAEADLATVRDTLEHRSDALNRTGASNDQLRATLARVRALPIAALPGYADGFVPAKFIIEALADQEPASE